VVDSIGAHQGLRGSDYAYETLNLVDGRRTVSQNPRCPRLHLRPGARIGVLTVDAAGC